jgi:hypothetical protein
MGRPDKVGRISPYSRSQKMPNKVEICSKLYKLYKEDLVFEKNALGLQINSAALNIM